MADKKVEELGTVEQVYISGMCELDSGKRIPKKIGAVTLKKGDKIIKEDGVVKVAPKSKTKRLTAAEKKAERSAENKNSSEGENKEPEGESGTDKTPEAE